MSIITHLNPFHHQHKFASTTNGMIGITEDGKKALDNGLIERSQYPIMLALDSSSMSINNIARESGMNPQAVEVQVKRLRSQGYVAIRNYEQER